MAFFIVLSVYLIMCTSLIGTMRREFEVGDAVGVFEVIAIPIVGFILGCILGKYAFGAFKDFNDWASANIFVLLISGIVMIVIALGGVFTGFFMISKWIDVWAWLAVIPIALGLWLPWTTLVFHHAAM